MYKKGKAKVNVIYSCIICWYICPMLFFNQFSHKYSMHAGYNLFNCTICKQMLTHEITFQKLYST